MNSRISSTELRNVLTGFILAAPILVFPFSRIHTLFFVIILCLACISCRELIQPRSQTPLILGIIAIAVPICITGLTLRLLGNDWEWLSIKKLGTVLVGGAFGLATFSLIKKQPDSAQVANRIITSTVLFWMIDGLIQLMLGHDLFGIALNDGRVGIFATSPLDFAYYFPLFAVFPIIYFYNLPEKVRVMGIHGKLLSLFALVLSIVIAFAGGCRNSMLLIGIVSILWMIAYVNDARSRFRKLVIPLFSALFPLVVILFYRFNDVFQQRADQSARILFNPSYREVNEVLSKRLDIWQPAIEVIQSNILFGIGPNQFRSLVLDALRPGNYFYQNTDFIMHAHHVLIEIALGTGAIGLICFIAYYLYVAKHFFSLSGIGSGQSSFSTAGTIAFLLMWLPIGTHYNIYGSMQIFYSFYFLAISFCGFTREGGLRFAEKTNVHSGS